MARRRIRSCIISIALIFAGAVPLHAQRLRTAELAGQIDRVTFLLVTLADQARSSEDLAFAVRAQSQAATLLWPYDREGARLIFRRAFGSLAPIASLKPGDGTEVARKPANSELKTAEKQQLRTELLNHIAGRDPELAEDLARALVYSVDTIKDASRGSIISGAATLEGRPSSDASPFLPVAGSRMAEVERREVLMGVALRIVEREPHRAMTLGQLSLPLGISPNFARLLTLMRAADRNLADLLFSSAVTNLERSRTVDLADLHTLGSYLISSAVQSGETPVNESLIVRFLKLTFDQVMRHNNPYLVQADQSAFDRAAMTDQSAAAYFIGRQLSDLFALYLPGRLPELQRKIAELSEDSALDKVVDSIQMEARASGPNDIVYKARTSSNENERNQLYARAALAWLGKGEVGEAQAAASQIADVEMRDRVLTQIARRQTSEGRIDDAVAIARRIEDDTSRVSALVRLADAALATDDRVRATELLNEAEKEAARARPSIARAQSLLTIVSSFSAFDPLRAFEVMETAVEAINDLLRPQKEVGQKDQALSKPSAAITPPVSLDEIYNLNFKNTLAVLARVDFDRALLLAQELAIKDASVIAQLAVCQGGLTIRPLSEPSTDGVDASRF